MESYHVGEKKNCCFTLSTAGGCKELQCASHCALTSLCVLCVWCVEYGRWSWHTVALILQVLPLLGEKKKTSLCRDHPVQGDSMLSRGES